MMLDFKNKRGSISATLTWTGAFLAIFFIMILFLAMSSVLSLKKIVPSWIGGEPNEIGLEEGEKLGDLQSQEKLYYILNFPIGEGKSMKDLILERGNSGVIENNAEKILEEISGEDDCYFFRVLSEGKDNVLVGKGVSPLIYLEHASSVDFYVNNKKINAALSFNKC